MKLNEDASVVFGRLWRRYEGLRIFVKTVVGVVVLGLAISIVMASHQTLDESGWITHDHVTPVWIDGNWMVGEYRTCQLLTTTPIAGAVQSPDARSELPRLLCGRNETDAVAGSLSEFENAVPGWTSATNPLSGGSDWTAFDSYFHVLPVRYSGRIERPDKMYDSWRCQRNGSSLLDSKNAITCWALD